MAVDYSTDVGKVRALIPDTEEIDYTDSGTPSFLIDDDQIEALLAVNSDNIKRAAADAIDALATSEAYISKVTRTEDLQTDGAKVGNMISLRAARLRASADEDEERELEDAFTIVPFHRRPVSTWGWPR